MLTGMNCLFSVLYPITIADFMVAHVTDQIMNGVLDSFPAKYDSKVGYTTSGKYNFCASEFDRLGLYFQSLSSAVLLSSSQLFILECIALVYFRCVLCRLD